MSMTEYAMSLVNRHEAAQTKLTGIWNRKGCIGQHVVEVISDNNLGQLLVKFPDGMTRERSKQWFLSEYEN